MKDSSWLYIIRFAPIVNPQPIRYLNIKNDIILPDYATLSFSIEYHESKLMSNSLRPIQIK